MSEAGATGPASGSRRLVNNKTRLIVAGVVLALSLGYLLYTAFPGSVRYYLTISEFRRDESSLVGKPVRVVGKLEPGSHIRPEGTLDHSFTLLEGEQSLSAFYSGVLPDLFENEHSDVVLEGTYLGDTFHADTVIIKCPSKYQALVRDQEA